MSSKLMTRLANTLNLVEAEGFYDLTELVSLLTPEARDSVRVALNDYDEQGREDLELGFPDEEI